MNTDKGQEESWGELKYDEVMNAVERGDESAKTKLAWLKLSGVGGCEVDEDGSAELLEERVKEGDGEAMWMLGVCNEYGRGTDQDIARAELLYKQSSERGNKIGELFETQKEIERNLHLSMFAPFARKKEFERGNGKMKMKRL